MTRLLSTSTSSRCLKKLAESSTSRTASTGVMASVSHLVVSAAGGRAGESHPQHQAMSGPVAVNGVVPANQWVTINGTVADHHQQDKFHQQRDEYSTAVEAALEQVLETQRTGYSDGAFEDVVRNLVKVGDYSRIDEA